MGGFVFVLRKPVHLLRIPFLSASLQERKAPMFTSQPSQRLTVTVAKHQKLTVRHVGIGGPQVVQAKLCGTRSFHQPQTALVIHQPQRMRNSSQHQAASFGVVGEAEHRSHCPSRSRHHVRARCCPGLFLHVCHELDATHRLRGSAVQDSVPSALVEVRRSGDAACSQHSSRSQCACCSGSTWSPSTPAALRPRRGSFLDTGWW